MPSAEAFEAVVNKVIAQGGPVARATVHRTVVIDSLFFCRCLRTVLNVLQATDASGVFDKLTDEALYTGAYRQNRKSVGGYTPRSAAGTTPRTQSFRGAQPAQPSAAASRPQTASARRSVSPRRKTVDSMDAAAMDEDEAVLYAPAVRAYDETLVAVYQVRASADSVIDGCEGSVA